MTTSDESFFGSSDTPDTSSSEENASSYPTLPSFYHAADAHNIGSGDFKFTDPSTWSEGIGNVGKFILGSAYSGGNSFYNTGVAIGNWLGADLQENDTASALSDIDSDLGRYYSEHKAREDVAGFIAGSLIPGLGEVKLLNAGMKVLKVAAKTGKFGSNISKSLGLLEAPEVYAGRAGKEIAATQASFGAMNANTLKALAAGYGQSVLETAAFQTAAAVTMFKSPVLDGADAGDIIKDIVFSSFEFGAIGGVLSGAKTFSTIRKAYTLGDRAEKDLTLTTQLPKSLGAGARISQAAEDIENTPTAESTIPAELATDDASKATFLRKHESLRSSRLSKLWGGIRENINSLASGDTELGNQVANIVRGLGKTLIQSAFTGAEQIGRIGSKLLSDKEAKQVSKLYPLGLPEGVSPARQSLFFKLIGEDSGAIVDEHPGTVHLADVLKDGDAVRSAIGGYKFKVGNLWNPISKADKPVDSLEAEARYWWAQNIAKVTNGMTVHEFDIPLMERIWKDWRNPPEGAGPLESVTLQSSVNKGLTYSVTAPEDLFKAIKDGKERLGLSLLESKVTGNSDITLDAIANITNTRKSYLLGDQNAVNEGKDLFAKQSFQKEYNDGLVRNGLKKPSDPEVDTTFLPKWMKVSVNEKPLQGADGMLLSGASYLTAMEKLGRQAVDNVVTKAMGYIGVDAGRLIPISKDMLLSANRGGAGPGRFLFANGSYGTLASLVEYLGTVTSDISKALKDRVRKTLDPHLYALGQNQDAAIEKAAIDNLINSTAEQYMPSADGTSLVHRGLQDYADALRGGDKTAKRPVIQDGAPTQIPIKNKEVQDYIKASVELNGGRVEIFKELRASQGLESNWDSRVYYPVRPNIRDYKHFALVVDNSVAGGSVGQKSMIHAASDAQLEQMIDKVTQLGPRYTTYTKGDLERYFKENGDFDYSKTLHEPYIDATLKKSGINNQFFQQTDPKKIVTDALNHHLQASDILVRELINAKYEPEFATLRKFGEQYTGVASSQYTGSFRNIESVIKNPYVNYIKTALNLKQTAEYPQWNSINTMVDAVYSKAHYAVSEIFQAAKTTQDLDKVNAALQKYGMRSAYYDTATALLANHPAPKDALARFVRGANAVLSTLTLGLDPLNALINRLGSNILLGSETKNLIKRIQQGNKDAAGELTQLMSIPLLGSEKDLIRSPLKLIAGSERRFFGLSSFSPKALVLGDKGVTDLDKFYIDNGWIQKDISEVRAIHSEATLTGAETVKDLDSKRQKLFDLAKKFSDWGYRKTGNYYAEVKNRWVSADVMKQITDIAVKHKIISPEEQLSYINTFVNRTQGNFLASQRPIYFQGPIGNAIGLFQTYQFNLMQQLFRYVGEGSAKDAGMLLGLQSTIFGLNGLPAFNFMNTHIVGSLSSNPKHNDLYSGTFGLAGETAGNWLLYGLPSNLLHTNLYSRGDINPRQVTVIPTNIADVPIINATATFFGNIKNMLGRLNDGGSTWQTVLQGIEHNGLSRPLAGLAQVAQITSTGKEIATSRQGTILGANDLFSLATLSRLAGGRPLDEAIVNDAAYRTTVYQALDTKRKRELAEAVKSSVIGGNMYSQNQYETFAARYAEIGGDQKRFNQYMMKQITSANTPLAEKIMQDLKSPYAQNMQKIMGGRDLFDE